MSYQNQEGSSDRAQNSRKDKIHHHGYSPVLVRTELKDMLREYRHQNGFGYDTHIERCLVSAALDMLLANPSLHDQWLTYLAEATGKDVLLAASAKVRGPGTAVTRHAAPGPEPLARGGFTPKR